MDELLKIEPDLVEGDIKKRIYWVDDIRREYSIELNKHNSKILGKAFKEVVRAKIEYLIDTGKSIVDKKGNLIDIFNMSSKDMEEV